MPTTRQISAVHFCEEWLHISFEGNIKDRHEVSSFLSEYLDDAKLVYDEVKCEYESYIMELWD